MYATFGDDRLRGLGVARGQISHFPIDLHRHPYNTCTTVRVCDYYSFIEVRCIIRFNGS